MRHNPQPQEIYRHFKGNLYQICTLAKHSETGELMVVYQALYGDFQIYVRPLAMFMEEIDREKYPNVPQQYRFELQSAMEENKMVIERAEPVQEKPQIVSTVENEIQEELHIDPLVLEFLDADSYERRLEILSMLHCRIDNEMINTMAVAVDIEIKEGDIEERYEELKNCLLTFEKYECNRLR